MTYIRTLRTLGTVLALSALALFAASPSASAKPRWDGSTMFCKSGEQVRLVIHYRGVLQVYWNDGQREHSTDRQYSGPYSTITYDTMAERVNWRAEASRDNNGIAGDIDKAYATCVSD